MPPSLQCFWLGRCNGMRHPLCSVIWLSGDSGVNLLRARHPILLHLPLVSCLTGCCKTPAVKVWLPAHGRRCPGCHGLPDYLRCTKLLTLQWPKRFFMLPARSHGVRPCPFLSALSAGWSAGSCRPTPPWLTGMLRAACSAPSGVRYVGLTPGGWRHPQSTFNWSRAAWSASLPGPKLPKPACTGVHCCLASLGLLLPAGASHFGRCCLRSCISRVEWILTASWIFCRPSLRVQYPRPLCSALCTGLRPYLGFALYCRSTGLLCPPCQCQRHTLWSAFTVPRLPCCPGPDNSTCLSPCAVSKDIINLLVLSPQFICMVGTM